jgi:hypothetical protein
MKENSRWPEKKIINLTDLKNNEMSFVEKKKMSSKMVLVWPKKA